MKNGELSSTRQRVRYVVENTGKYQVILCLLLSIHSAIVAFNHTEPAFLNYVPSFRCKDSPTTDYSGCASIHNDTCEAGFEYAETDRTIVTEFSLVCSQSFFVAFATMTYFGGVTIGALLFGPLADRWGRRKVALICLYTQAVLGILQGLIGSHSGIMGFAILRMLQGAFVQGLQSSTFTLLLEMFPVRHRTAVAVVWEIFWAIGCAFMAYVAWIIEDWRYMQIILATPALISVLYIWNVPESALWLTTVGRYKCAHQVCDKIVRFNRLEEDMNRNSTACSQTDQLMEKKISDPVIEKVGLIGIFKSSVLRKHAFVMIMVWFSVTLSYYATVFYLPKLEGQRHINFLIGAFIEVVAYVLAFWALSKLGRRWPTALYLMLCGLISATVAGIMFSGLQQGILVIVLILIGKGAAVSCFCCMFLYTSELFPTSVRGAALGLCGFWSRIGGFLSPLLLVLGDYTDRSVPLMCLSVLALATGGFSLILPDTSNTTLPDTIEEAQAAYRKSSSNSRI